VDSLYSFGKQRNTSSALGAGSRLAYGFNASEMVDSSVPLASDGSCSSVCVSVFPVDVSV
jgi:hypothetical protein